MKDPDRLGRIKGVIDKRKVQVLDVNVDILQCLVKTACK